MIGPATIANSSWQMSGDEPAVEVDPYNKEGSPEDVALVRKQDLRIIPLSAFIYLLCYLDRSNIGNAKVLNKEDKNDLLDETGMSNYQYT